MDYDFSDLSPAQEWLIVTQGWTYGSSFPQPSPRTAKKLIERGLVIPHEYKLPRTRSCPLEVTVTEYEVPLHVHFAFCMRGSDQRERRRKKAGA